MPPDVTRREVRRRGDAGTGEVRSGSAKREPEARQTPGCPVETFTRTHVRERGAPLGTDWAAHKRGGGRVRTDRVGVSSAYRSTWSTRHTSSCRRGTGCGRRTRNTSTASTRRLGHCSQPSRRIGCRRTRSRTARCCSGRGKTGPGSPPRSGRSGEGCTSSCRP